MTNAQKQAILMSVIILDTICELGSVPSGVLYAQVMGKMDVNTYNAIIGALTAAKLISRSNHVLTATPKGRDLAESSKAAGL
jgi:hypothetical protein